MDDQNDSAEAKEPGRAPAAQRLWTAVGHSCGLAAFIGAFIAASAYSTDPRSAVVRVGVVIAVAGVLGFLVARRMGGNRGA